MPHLRHPRLGEVLGKLDEYDRRLHADYRVATDPIRSNVGMGIAAIIHSPVYSKGRQP